MMDDDALALQNGVLDKDFRSIIKRIPLESKRNLIVEFGDETAKQRALSRFPESEPPKQEHGPKVCVYRI